MFHRTSSNHWTALFGSLLFVLCAAPSAAAGKVTILRDRYGVPHIFGDSPEDVAYGVAIAQCQDNLPIVIRNLFAGVGRLSEVMGPDQLESDIQARELGHGYFAARDWPELSPGLQRMLGAYCDGVNEYMQGHPNELPFAVPPVEPLQIVAWNRSVMLLSAVAISKADAEASKADGYLPADTHPQANSHHPGVPPGKSNSWALASFKTAAGVPLLLVDPHWATEGPLQLYEAYLHGGDLQGGGFMLHGSPLIGLGVTPAAAWTLTAGGADSSDAYALRIHPDDPGQYEFDGQWKTMSVRRETIRVRDGDGYREEIVEARSTLHGPVWKTKTGVPYAAAFSGHDHADSIEQTYRMVTARSTRDFEAALALDRYTYFNVMWATTDGEIGYLQTGNVPLRPAGFNWQKLLPGWTSGAMYRGRVPFDQLPRVKNPPTGFLQNCNVAANVVTPGLTFKAEDFPPGALWGHYGAYRARGQRATQLLTDVDHATLEDAQRIAFDTYVPPADLWVPLIIQALDECAGDSSSPGDEEQLLAEAGELLRSWDRHATRDSRGATVFRFWRLECNALSSPVGRDDFHVPNTLEVRQAARQALARATRRLQQTYGRVAVPWGEIKVLRRGDKTWPLSGDGLDLLGMDTLRATAASKFSTDHKLPLAGGQCITSIVLMTSPPTIRSVAAYGQSNRPGTRHFDDQAPLYSTEQFREVLWSRDSLDRQAESTETLEYDSAAVHE